MATSQDPKDTVRHFSGSLNSEGLSEEWVKFEKQLGFRPMVNLQGTIEEQRKAHNDGCANRNKSYSTRVLKEGVLTQDEEIKTQPGLSAIPIRIYRRSGRQSSTSPLPAAVFFHGGGWILGDLQSDDFLCRKMAYELDHLIISVDYRLAPEHVFPAAIEDCYDAFKWTVDNAEALGIDRKKIYVTGNSAGGHLAATVAIKVAQSEDPSALAAQVLRIPMTCHPQMFPGKLPERENVPIFNDTAGSIMLHTFVPNAADRTSLWLSPLLMDAATLQKLPPTYIDVCSADPFCIGGIAYAKRIEGLGVPVKLYVLKGMPHGSYILFPDLPSSQAAHTACMAGTEWALNCKK